MPTYWPSINDDVAAWIKKQPLFFTASAPTHGKHVNVSPKGQPSRTFAILNPNQVAYLDGTGSGIETVSHVYENGRVTIMFCSFTKFCRILRLFCTGRVIERESAEFRPFLKKMHAAGMRIETPDPKAVSKIDDKVVDVDYDKTMDGNGVRGVRAIIVLDVWKVQHSCGYGVPLLAGSASDVEHEVDSQAEKKDTTTQSHGTHSKRSEDPNDPHSVKFDEVWDDRNVLDATYTQWYKKDKMKTYRSTINAASLDDCPGLQMAIKDAGRSPMQLKIAHRFQRIFISEQPALFVGVLLGLFLALVFQRVAVRL